MSSFLYIIVSVLCLTSYSYCQSNPCDTYQPIPEIHRRDASYRLSRGEESINDRNIREGWYGNFGVALLSEAPGFYKCGGWYPIWRTDSDPDGRTASLCVETSSETCSNPFDIEVRQCDGIEIYKLLKAPTNRASYCFEVVPDDPPEFSVKPTINVHLNHELKRSKMLFRCEFSPSEEEDLFYNTFWFVEGTPLDHSFGPSKWNDDYLERTTLTEDLLKANGIMKPGFNLQCSVRAQYNPGRAYSTSSISDRQFVGVKINAVDRLTLEEGQTKLLPLQLTVPFGCGTELEPYGVNCQFDIDVGMVRNGETDCNPTVVTQNACGIKPIMADVWNAVTHLTLVGQISSTDGIASAITHIKLKTPKSMEYLPFWQDYEIGNVAMTVTKDTRTISNVKCSATNDPYIRRFGSSTVYGLDMKDVFTLYKDNDEGRTIEVQIETEKCDERVNNQFCTCGVAVRAGGTVFEISHCRTAEYFIRYTACRDGEDVLQVRKEGDMHYIHLPTGTVVYVQFKSWPAHDVWWLNVWLFPTVRDEGKNRGMCGNVATPNVFTTRVGLTTTSFAEFAASWRVRPEENLFDFDVVKEIEASYTPKFKYCACDDSGATDFLTCSVGGESHQCILPRGVNVKPKKCAVPERKKRAVHHKPLRTKRQAISSQTWNESAAIEYCEARFLESNTVQTVKDIPGANVWIEEMKTDCVTDIKNSGTTMFSAMAVAGVRMYAMHEAMVNPVLRQNNVTNPSEPTLFDKITLQTCQADCNGKGSCSQGECICNAGYGGSDCSIDLSTPPVVIDTEDGDHCDRASGDCQVLNVFGQVFSGEEDAKCRIRKTEIKSTGETERSNVTSSAAVSESVIEVECTLPEADPAEVVTDYVISVSHAGDVYSNEITVLVYDSTCVTVNNETRAWTIQNGYCIYKGKCFGVGDRRSDNASVQCVNTNGVSSWKTMTDDSSSASPYINTTTPTTASNQTTLTTASELTTPSIASHQTTLTTASEQTTPSTASHQTTLTTASHQTTLTTASHQTTPSTASNQTTLTTASELTTPTTASHQTTLTTASEQTTSSTASHQTTLSTASNQTTLTTASEITTPTTASHQTTLTTASEITTPTTASNQTTLTTASELTTPTTASHQKTLTTASEQTTPSTTSHQTTLTTASHQTTLTTASEQTTPSTTFHQTTLTTASHQTTLTTASHQTTPSTASNQTTLTTASHQTTPSTASHQTTLITASELTTPSTASHQTTSDTASHQKTLTTASKQTTLTTASELTTPSTESNQTTLTTASKQTTLTTASEQSLSNQTTLTTASKQTTPSTASEQTTPSTASNQTTLTTASEQTTPNTASNQTTPTTASKQTLSTSASQQTTLSVRVGDGDETSKSAAPGLTTYTLTTFLIIAVTMVLQY